MPQRKNLILKVLIVLGLLAILASSYVQFGIPYLEEQEKQKNDEQRIADLNALDAEIKSALAVNSSAFTGASTTVYISLPSNDLLCANLELPSLPDGWTYRCASPSNFTNSSAGWLPIDFAYTGPPALPMDPINSADTLNYYAFVGRATFSTTTTATASTSSPQASIEYVLTAVLDSKKYLTEKAQTDGGSDPIRYEAGDLPKLWSDANVLIAYFPMTESNAEIVSDISNSALKGLLLGQLYDDSVSFFDGKSNYIFISSNQKINALGSTPKNYSVALSFKTTANKNSSLSEKWINSSSYPWALRIENSKVVFGVYDGENWSGTSAEGIAWGEWNTVVGIVDNGRGIIQLYLNGNLGGSSPYEFTRSANQNEFTIGARNIKGDKSFAGFIKDFMIYERTLGEPELDRFFIPE